MHSIVAYVSSVVLFTCALKDRTVELVESAIRHHVAARFAALRGRVGKQSLYVRAAVDLSWGTYRVDFEGCHPAPRGGIAVLCCAARPHWQGYLT